MEQPTRNDNLFNNNDSLLTNDTLDGLAASEMADRGPKSMNPGRGTGDDAALQTGGLSEDEDEDFDLADDDIDLDDEDIEIDEVDADKVDDAAVVEDVDLDDDDLEELDDDDDDDEL